MLFFKLKIYLKKYNETSLEAKPKQHPKQHGLCKVNLFLASEVFNTHLFGRCRSISSSAVLIW